MYVHLYVSCLRSDRACLRDVVSCTPALGSVAVLNFAHGYNCGGGFEHAAGSQEEAIFRSTSAPHLDPSADEIYVRIEVDLLPIAHE